MAHTRMEAEQPGDEFQIAVVGPLSSLAIAALLYGLVWAGGPLGWPDAVRVVLQYIAVLNVILALFNLLPGFPLDGGRLFRSAVWKYTGDLDKATRVASMGGRWLGYALVALGILQAFAGALIGGLWLVFIGWFLRNAAIASYTQHVVRDVLEDVRARDIMTEHPETVPADLTVRELLDDHFMRRRFVSFPVADASSDIVGLVTLSRIKEVPRDEWDVRTARDAMIPADEKIVVAPDDGMLGVIEKLRESPARRVLVMRDGRLVGIITANDVAGWVQKAKELRAT
jgi:CBS domain-containing protein